MKVIFKVSFSTSVQHFRSLAFIGQIVLMLLSSSWLKAQENEVPIISATTTGGYDCDVIPACANNLEKLVCLIGNTSSVSVLTSGSNPKLLPMPDAATTPQNIVISKDLVVDIDYTFAPGSTIVVLETVAIKVNTGITFSILEKSLVRGCEKMWQGIQVELGGILNLQDMTLEDAGIGVHMKSDGSPQLSSKITVENCTFNLCLTSIALGNTSALFSGATISNNIISKINNNYFSGLGPLKTNNLGFSSGLIGIHMNSILPITLLKNTIENYAASVNRPSRGIQIYNSSPLLVYCKFTNIGFSDMGLKIGRCIEFNNPPTKRIRIWRGDAQYVGYFLYSKQFGSVECLDVNIAICNYGIYLIQDFSNNVLTPITISANANSISSYVSSAIRINFGDDHVVRSVQVDGNTFIDDAPQCDAIEWIYPYLDWRFAVCIASAVPKVVNSQINNNSVTNSIKPGCGVKRFHYGIVLARCNKGNISSNTLIDNNSTPTPGATNNGFAAILIHESDDIAIQENILDGQANVMNTPGKQSTAIEVRASRNSTLFCNDMNNFQIGMLLNGSPTDGASVTKNIFRIHITGIKLTEDAIIGQQQAGANRWLGSPGQTEGRYEFPLDVNDQVSIDQVLMSQFQINNANTNSVFWANPRLVGTIPNDGFWFVSDPNSTQIPDNEPISCLIGGGSSSSRLSKADQFVLAGSFPLYRGFAATGWDAQFRLYDRISRETALLAPIGSPAKNFYDTHSGSANLGTLHAAWKQASNFGVSTSATATQMNQISEDISGILTQMGAIDESLSDANTSIAVLQSLKAQRDLLLTNYETKESALQTLSAQFTVTEKQAANTQLANLNSLTVNNTWEQNFKDVVSIILSMEANSTNATSTQQATLQGIATQCLYAGGYGVLLARSLYQGYDTNHTLTDAAYAAIDAVCSGERTTPVEKGENTLISVQPNPANDYLQVVINGDYTKGMITLMDITGRLVFETPATGKVTPISTERLTNGIYYLVVNTEGQVSQTLKVVITH